MTGRTKNPISLALDPDLMERLDKWLKSQELPPSKTTFFELAIRKLLDEKEAVRISN